MTIQKIVNKEVKQHIENPQDIVKIIEDIINAEPEAHRKKEHFYVVGLNTRSVIEYVELVSLGTLNESLVHPREVFRSAIVKSVASIIVIHNHPSGDTEPSEDDLRMVKALREAGNILRIELVDSLIIGNGCPFFSWKNKNLL